jgi:hypothetical protein
MLKDRHIHIQNAGKHNLLVEVILYTIHTVTIDEALRGESFVCHVSFV